MRAQASQPDRIAAVLLLVLTALVALTEWGLPGLAAVNAILACAVIVLLVPGVRWSRRAFVAVALVLSAVLALRQPGWSAIVLDGLAKSAFIAAFFIALSTLRNVAETSPAIQRGGAFLAEQPPGRRYAALTMGGHLFALLLNYGSIALLGSLASASAWAEPDVVIRAHRTRRMLLAIQRGFIASLTWSPLAFAMAITTALIPGARWADAALPGLVSAAIITGTGWALDLIFKPRLATPPAPRASSGGSWGLMWPLAGLLGLLTITVATLHETTGVRVVGVVMLVVPVIAVGWAAIQSRGHAPGAHLGPRLRAYVETDIPGYRGEIVLLMMAGYIGTVGAPLLVPVVAKLGAALGQGDAALPTWLVLAGFVWLVPLMGQLGMNPILAVTLLAPLIPDAGSLGVPPAALVVSISAGWALSGATSPFTATTLLIASFAKVSALHVGVRWNGAFFVLTAALLSLWVVAYGLWLG